jgi:hypothetical protein
LRWPRDTLYPLNLALTSPTSGGRSVGIVRWRTKAPKLVNFGEEGCGQSRSILPKGLKKDNMQLSSSSLRWNICITDSSKRSLPRRSIYSTEMQSSWRTPYVPSSRRVQPHSLPNDVAFFLGTGVDKFIRFI